MGFDTAAAFRWTSGLLRLAVWTALVGVGLNLASCAGGPGTPGQGASKADIITASDESDIHRRARLRLELAVGYFEQGQTTIALDELKKSIATDPDFGDAYSLRGLVYMRLNEPGLAEESFRRALVLKPADPAISHNYAWMLCQYNRHTEAARYFAQALADPQYIDRAKTYLSQGMCQIKEGRPIEAEASLRQAFELDAGNPITEYNLALLQFRRGDLVRAQFNIRRLNNSEWANAESLWLGIKIERKLGNREAVAQLATPLRKRFSGSRELGLFERGAFDE